MDSFDISQYTIEVSMENDDNQPVDTATYTTICYPKLDSDSPEFEEDGCGLKDDETTSLAESSDEQEEEEEEKEEEIPEEPVPFEFALPHVPQDEISEDIFQEESPTKGKVIAMRKKEKNEETSKVIETAKVEATISAMGTRTLIVEVEAIVVEKDNELSLKREDASASEEVTIFKGEFFSTKAEPISLDAEVEIFEEVASITSMSSSNAFVREDIVSVKAESIPSTDSLVFVSKFNPLEPSEDTEPWNLWLFTQLKHILDAKADNIAIVEEIGETRCVTYRELMDGIMKTATYLKHHDVGEGDVVGFCMESCFEFVLYQLACFFLGALPVLFHPSHIASDRITRLKVRVMVCDADHYGHVLRGFTFFENLEKIFVLSDDLTTIYIPSNVWIYDGLGFLDFKCDLRLKLGRAPRNVVAFATSGTSSSRGKIVAHSAQSCKSICTHYYTELLSLLREKHPEETKDVHLVSTGLHTIDGFSYCIYSLIHGGILVLTETNADIWKVSFLDRVAGLIERYKIPVLMVHSQFLKCFNKYEIHKIYNVDSLKLMCHSGSTLPPSVVGHIRNMGISLTQAYITTETGAFSLDEVTNSHDLIPTCGEPFLGNNVKILEQENETEVAPGKWGRLWVQGSTLFSEYLCDAKFTESCSNGWFFTGDFAMVDEQARLFVAGPVDGLAQGPKGIIPLVLVESILVELPEIDDVAICKMNEEFVLGLVLIEGEMPPSVDSINKKLNDKQIALIISRVVVVDFIPKSETGKLLRSELAFLFELEQETEADLDFGGGIETEPETDHETNYVQHEQHESSI